MAATWRAAWAWLDGHASWCMAILRIYLGLALMMKGVSFALDRGGLKGLIDAHGLEFQTALLAQYIIAAHLGGGAAMAMGLMTRVGAAVQVPILLGAVAFIHWGGGIFAAPEELEFSALVLLCLLLFVWHGAGELSLEAWILGPERRPA